MSVESELAGWVISRYNEIISRMSIETPLVMHRGAPVSVSEFLEAFNEAWAMPEDTEEAKDAKREALERVLPCEEESYAASCEADDVRTLLIKVMPKEKVAESDLLSAILNDMNAVVKSYYFMTEGVGPSWWYR